MVVVLVLLHASITAVLCLTPVSVPGVHHAPLALHLVVLDQHVESERLLSQLQLLHQLLLFGLQLLQDQARLHLLPRLHQMSLLQNVQLKLLNN